MDATTRQSPQASPNHLGIKGWVYAGRYSIERYLYILHRVTGLGLVLYLLLHIVETGQRMGGSVRWEGLMALFATPVFRFLEYVVFVGFGFHALNGLRLHFTELGFFLGKPAQPVYPYPSSLKRHRPLTYVLMILTAVALILGASSLFFS